MIEKLIRGMRRALALHQPGRNLEVFPDDNGYEPRFPGNTTNFDSGFVETLLSEPA